MKPIHTRLLALIVSLILAATVYRNHTRDPESTGKAGNIPPMEMNEIADGHATHPKSRSRARTEPAPITDLDEAERLLMESDIDPSDRNAQTEGRMGALIKRIDPSLLGLLLARIDTSLTETGYFQAANQPAPARVGAIWHPPSEKERKMDMFREFLMREWAIHDLDDALAYSLSAERGNDREKFVITALSTRVNDEPLDALARVAELPDPELGGRVRQEVYRAWLIEKPMSAFSWASNWQDNSERKAYLGIWGAEVAKTDPKLALRAAEGIRTIAERNQAMHGIASSWSLREPETMAFYLRNNPCSTAADTQAMVGVLVYNWYQRDKQSTLNWITGLPEGQTRGEAVRFLTQVMKVEWPVTE